MLTLLGCSLSSAGVAAIAASLPPTLEELDLSRNKIGEEGAMALAKGLPQQLKIFKVEG